MTAWTDFPEEAGLDAGGLAEADLDGRGSESVFVPPCCSASGEAEPSATGFEESGAARPLFPLGAVAGAGWV